MKNKSVMNNELIEDNLSIEEKLIQREAELAIISSVSEAISKRLDAKTITRIIGDKVKEIFNSEVTEILLLNETTNMIDIPYSYYRGYQTADSFQLGEGLTSKVIKSAKPLVIGTFEESLKNGVIVQSDEEKTETYIGVPIISHEKVLGVVSIQSYKKNDYNDEKVRLLSILSSNMGVALENARLFEETNILLNETKQRNAELGVINSVQEGLAKELDINGIYELVGEKIREIFNAQVIDIVSYDKNTNMIRDSYSYEKGDRTLIGPRPLTGFRKHIVKSLKPLVINKDNEKESIKYGNKVVFGEMPKSLLFVPMITGGEVSCIISLQNLDIENAFSESDVRLLTTLANSMSVALENARLFDETNRLLKETEQRSAELTVINSVQEGLVKQVELNAIFELVGEKIREIFDAQVVSIGVYDYENELCQFKYDIEKGERFFDEPRKFISIDKHLINFKKILLVNSNIVDELVKIGEKKPKAAEGTEMPKSAIWVPMIVDNNVKGYVSLQNIDRENAFSDSDVRLLTTLTNSMSVALENARLFDETNKLLEETKQQAIELKIINSVGEGLAKQLDFQSIIDLVGEKIREVFSAQVVSISTYEKETEQIHHRYAVELDKRFYFDKPQAIDNDRKEIIESKQPLIFGTAKEAIEHSGEEVVAGEMPESFMGVPIIRNQEVTGVITVQDIDKKYLYTKKDVRLLMTLASNMGVALENARLFEETKRLLNETQQRNVELSILNAIQEGLVMEMDFNSIINLVGDKFREALGFLDLGIRIYDKEKNILHYPYEYEHGKRLNIESMEPTPLSDYVLKTGKMLLLKKVTDEEIAKLGITGKTTIPGTDESKSLVFVPIIVGTEAKGLILIENYEKEDAFSDSDIRLLTTVANSMSVALENARLFNETLRLLDESKKRTAELSTVNSISQAIVGHLEINKLINLVGDKVRDLFNANVVYVALLDKERVMINFPYGYGDEYPPLKLGNGLTSHIILKKEPLLINKEVDEMTHELGVARIGTPSASYLGVPIPVGSEIIGVLSVQSTEKENLFNEDDLRLLSTIAAHVGIAINNANAYEELNITLENLKSTQDQLIAQEKLASLGQLTAGIAHEIKNPLNFVNNFSELSVGLVDELNEELGKFKNKINEEEYNEVTDLLEMLKQNSEKIKEHGKRADSIVHSMLQHSRGKSGDKQPTDINSMLDEDLNLVYHGLRAQDNTFNIKIERNYKKDLVKLNVVPQDISRVFLNILTNGCYEAHRRKSETNSEEPAKIIVSTNDLGKYVEIRVRDNGSGIPKKIRDDLFTPFFTTKPAGKGTGLGLSISYDIVVQEHKGELFFETEEDKYTEFIIRLPK
ncbi:MAG: GAF domain-containing protein [Bacteroidetes bacterium]|nr:GAF domain-containing protein [Bacteroidota bacterium]